MGSDDLFHKRKARAAKSLERRKAKRSSYNKILIVCEGEKTEPNYFKDLIQYHRLNTANVEIDGSCGSSPKSVYERAVTLWKEEEAKGDPFDQVYCVFDKDSHSTYDETLARIDNHQPKEVFFATTSVPCFEYWLLLHFEFTTKPYAATGRSSVADEVIKDLKKYMPEYSKGDGGVYTALAAQVETAKAYAAKSVEQAAINHTDNPTTSVGELVVLLQELKE